jgi:hypothetical protein
LIPAKKRKTSYLPFCSRLYTRLQSRGPWNKCRPALWSAFMPRKPLYCSQMIYTLPNRGSCFSSKPPCRVANVGCGAKSRGLVFCLYFIFFRDFAHRGYYDTPYGCFVLCDLNFKYLKMMVAIHHIE